MKRALPLLTTLICLLFFSTQVYAASVYKVSMLPRYSPEVINKRITPLAKELSQVLKVQVEPTIMINFDQYTKRLISGSVEVGYENPYIYVLASGTHEVLAMAVKGEDGDKFRGIIITKKGSPIKNVEDLKGKKIVVVSRTSAGGYLSQRLTMLEKGIDVEKECEVSEAVDNKHENVVISVFIGDADAGFIRESALNKADTFVPPSQIEVLNRSAWLPNWALSVNRSLPKQEKEAIQNALVNLKKRFAGFKGVEDRQFQIDYRPGI